MNLSSEMMLRDAFSELNPFVCVGYYAAVIGISAGFMHPLVLLCSFSGCFFVTCCRKGIRQTCRRFFCMLPLALFTAILNPLFSHEGATILTYLPSGNPLTLESLIYGAAAGLMMFNTLGWFLNLSEMMTGDKWIYLFGRTIPALSLVLSMIFRFVPKLMRQIRQTHDAVLLSEPLGDDMRSRLKAAFYTFSGVVSWALEDAAETADSMHSRGYGTGRRTIYSRYGFDLRDALTALLILLLAAVVFIFRPQWSYFPVFKMKQEASGIMCFALLCILPAVFGLYTDFRYGFRIRRLPK